MKHTPQKSLTPRLVALWFTVLLTVMWLAFLGLVVAPGAREGPGYAFMGLVLAPVGAATVFALTWAVATLLLPASTPRPAPRRGAGGRAAHTTVAVAPPPAPRVRRHGMKLLAALILLAAAAAVAALL